MALDPRATLWGTPRPRLFASTPAPSTWMTSCKGHYRRSTTTFLVCKLHVAIMHVDYLDNVSQAWYIFWWRHTLIGRFYWYKHEVMQFLLKMEYQRSMFAQREKMLANLDDKDKSDDIQVRCIRYNVFITKNICVVVWWLMSLCWCAVVLHNLVESEIVEWHV